MDQSTWNYNKDPHAGIYSIFRQDISNGNSEYVTGGPGGAARPIVSHKGDK